MTSSFQNGVAEWLLQCFGPEISGDKLERSDRFIEEALELVQSVGYPEERIAALIQYVYARPIGEARQEVGGVMVTLAAFCWSYGIDLDEAARKELDRIWTKIEAIRAKQAGKPTGSALPIAVQPDRNQFYSCLPCTWSATDVDCCTYPADKIYVDGAGTRFCAECAGEFRGGTQHMRKLSAILDLARPHLGVAVASVSKFEATAPASGPDWSGSGPDVAKLDRKCTLQNWIWLPISEADVSVTMAYWVSAELTLRNSDRFWVRDEDGRVFEAVWSVGKTSYWWDLENESPVNPVEFMPHPLDPRYRQSEGGAG